MKANRVECEIKAEYVKSVIKFSNQSLFKESTMKTKLTQPDPKLGSPYRNPPTFRKVYSL